jgi:hypothetical protein
MILCQECAKQFCERTDKVCLLFKEPIQEFIPAVFILHFP